MSARSTVKIAIAMHQANAMIRFYIHTVPAMSQRAGDTQRNRDERCSRLAICLVNSRMEIANAGVARWKEGKTCSALGV
jgi:hypothetical protein